MYKMTYSEHALKEPFVKVYYIEFPNRIRGFPTEIPIPDQSEFFGFYNMSIKIGLMGWIWIGFAFLNTLYRCQIHRFFDVLGKNQPSSLGCYFLRDRALVSNLSFFFVFGRTLIPECAYRP